MKLLRFNLPDDPRPRTGIFHEVQVYETDGERALGTHKPDEISLLSPVGRPSTIRFFDAFSARDGKPRFEFGNVAAIKAPEEDIDAPYDVEKLDFEMMIGAVLANEDFSLSAKEGNEAVLGYTVVNVWRSRDETREGTPKARDFAISVGPFLVTPDDLQDKFLGPGRLSLNMKALVNGEVIASANLADMQYTFGELIAEASRGAPVAEGDIVATGSPLRQTQHEFLRPGDEVTIVVERLGTLVNRVSL